ncbi:PAS domain S-box protein [bacterium]|nr:PAS domain S-box protein [bacterium]
MMDDHQKNMGNEEARDDSSSIHTETRRSAVPEEAPNDGQPMKEWTGQNENSLLQALRKYEILIDEVEDSIGEVDLQGKICFVNNASCKIWGRTREQLIGLTCKSYADPLNQKIIIEAFTQVFKTGVPKQFTYEIIRTDGSRRIVEDSVSPLRNQNDDIVGFRVVGRDITQRKIVERELTEHRSRLEAIFSSVKEAIITVDVNFKVTEANQATESICCVTAQEMVGKAFMDCPMQCSKFCGDVLKQTLAKKMHIKEYRIECSHQQHEGQLVSVTSAPLLDENGEYRGAVLLIRDISRLRNLERELRERHQFHNMIGRSKRMQDIYRLMEDLANLETTVLITGESGTGKELVARALHYSGQRAFQPFVAVNCSALTESLLESELFGHVKGAYTGAIKDKQGRFQAANGGTILLDEIGDISPLVQLKLLRVLQEKIIERVGDSEPLKVDIRVIASTNKDLKEKVRRGEFREDLYYRLKVVEVALPPLRERREDLPLLIDHFCVMFNERFHRTIEGVSQDVLNIFMHYPWYGNVRELEHTLEHAFILCRSSVIIREHLPLELQEFTLSERSSEPKANAVTTLTASAIIDALTKTRWNKTKAASLLGISRRTMHRKISEFQINQSI